MNNADNSPVLVTGAAGAVGGIGRSLTDNFLLKGRKVRALSGQYQCATTTML